MKTVYKTIIAGVVCFLAPVAQADNSGWVDALYPPSSDLQPIFKNYSTQGGKCSVWVTETLRPGTPIIGTNKVVYPYECYRPNHQYNCVDHQRNSGHTTPETNATYKNKLIFKYKLNDGIPSFSGYINPGNHEETGCGTLLEKHIKQVSTP